MKPEMFKSSHLFSKELWQENCNTTQNKNATHRREVTSRKDFGVAACPKNTSLSLKTRNYF